MAGAANEIVSAAYFSLTDIQLLASFSLLMQENGFKQAQGCSDVFNASHPWAAWVGIHHPQKTARQAPPVLGMLQHDCANMVVPQFSILPARLPTTIAICSPLGTGVCRGQPCRGPSRSRRT